MASGQFIAFSNITSLLERHRKFFAYFLAGGTCALIDLCVFFSSVYLFGLDYFPAGVLGFVIATLANYVLCIKFVFLESTRFKKRHQLLGVYAISIIGLSLHQLILYFGVDVLSAPLLLTKLGASGSVFYVNYWGRRRVIFGDSP